MDEIDLSRYTITKDSNLKDASSAIESIKDRAVLVIDEEKSIIGLISSGDIIRALISDVNIYSRVDNYLRTNFVYALEDEKINKEKIEDIFLNQQLSLLPIVNKQMQLKSVITLRSYLRSLRSKD